MQSLVRKADFKALVEQGKRFKPAPWLLINYDQNNLGHLRLGCTIGRKIGTSVVRNKLRRWSREWFRKNEDDLAADVNLLFLESRKQDFYKRLKHEELDLVLKNAYEKIRHILK